jgi:phenylacetate-CoA ligase
LSTDTVTLKGSSKCRASLPYFRACAAGFAGLFVERVGSARLLRRYRTARLRALLHHAYEHVPFYRRRFDEAGFHPDQFQTLEDLQRVPITRKSDLRLVSEKDSIARNVDPARLLRYGTGGSTGAPMEVRFTRFEDLLLRVMRFQVLMGFGMRWHDRRSTIVGYRELPRKGLLKRLGILHSQRLHALSAPTNLRSALREFRPDAIRGYPSVLALLSEAMTDEDRANIRPRFITTDSENLTELARKQIEEGFQAPVFDVYDCFECNVIASQCPRGVGYHVLDSSVVVEVVNGEEPVRAGESGEIVFTSLHTWAAPLIRYMPGDLVEQGVASCSCGAPNAGLAKIFGRMQDKFVLPDGRSFHPVSLTVWIYPLCSVLKLYQIIQESADCIVVKLQPASGGRLSEDMVATMRKGMAADLGEGIMLLVELVDHIPSEHNGKFRPYRSYADAVR